MPLINHKACCTSSCKPDRKQRIPARNRLHFMENIGVKATIMNKRGFNGQRSVGQHSRVREQRDRSIVRKPRVHLFRLERKAPERVLGAVSGRKDLARLVKALHV